MTDNKQNEPAYNAHGRRDALNKMAIAAVAAGSAVVPKTSQAKISEKETTPASPKRNSSTTDLENLGGSPISEGRYEKGEQLLPSVKERVLALKTLLIESEIIPAQMLDQFVEYYEKSVGPHLGAAVVAHAWKDKSFMNQLFNPPIDAPFKNQSTPAGFLF